MCKKVRYLLILICMLFFSSCIDEYIQMLKDEPLDPPSWIRGDWTYSTEPDENGFYMTVVWSFTKSKVKLTSTKYGLFVDYDGWSWDYGEGETYKETFSNDEYKVAKKNDSVYKLECYLSTSYHTVIRFTRISDTEIKCSNNIFREVPQMEEYILTKVAEDDETESQDDVEDEVVDEDQQEETVDERYSEDDPNRAFDEELQEEELDESFDEELEETDSEDIIF